MSAIQPPPTIAASTTSPSPPILPTEIIHTILTHLIDDLYLDYSLSPDPDPPHPLYTPYAFAHASLTAPASSASPAKPNNNKHIFAFASQTLRLASTSTLFLCQLSSILDPISSQMHAKWSAAKRELEDFRKKLYSSPTELDAALEAEAAEWDEDEDEDEGDDDDVGGWAWATAASDVAMNGEGVNGIHSNGMDGMNEVEGITEANNPLAESNYFNQNNETNMINDMNNGHSTRSTYATLTMSAVTPAHAISRVHEVLANLSSDPNGLRNQRRIEKQKMLEQEVDKYWRDVTVVAGLRAKMRALQVCVDARWKRELNQKG